jgi:RNA processing factor Prp31
MNYNDYGVIDSAPLERKEVAFLESFKARALAAKAALKARIDSANRKRRADQILAAAEAKNRRKYGRPW